MPRRLVAISEAFRVDDPVASGLTRLGFQLIDRHDLVHRASEEELVAVLDGAWGVVAGSERYTATVFERSPSVCVVARPGVGVDAIDVAAASRHGVAVVVTPGANDESVADLTLALMLAGLRRVIELDSRTRTGAWRPTWAGRDLSGATVGIVGLGAVGRAVVRRLSGFGCQIIAAEPSPDLDFCRRYAVELATLHEMLPSLDVLTIHVPLMTATRGLIGGHELRLLPRHALVVNAARGGIVDEAALADALRNGRLGGAALDVFEHEPLSRDDVLATAPNVVLSPHHAAFTVQAIARMVSSTVENLVQLAQGRLPAACINADRLEGPPWAAGAGHAPVV